MKKAIVSTINSSLTFDEIKKALKNESSITAQMCENLGYASDKLTAKDFDKKSDFDNWKKGVNSVRVSAYNLTISRKDGRLTSDIQETVYQALKKLFSDFDLKVKLDNKTAEYLSAKSVKTGTGKSTDILERESQIRDYRKQERTSRHPDLFKKEIESLQAEIKALKNVSCNAVKTDIPVSESVFRKTLEDYIAHRTMGIATM